MSLKTRLVLLSTLWLVLILMLFNVFIYFFVIKITTRSEVQALWNKYDTILQKQPIEDPDSWNNPKLFEPFLVTNELIRIINMEAEVVNQLTTNEQLLEKPVSLRLLFNEEIINTGEARFIFIQAPLYDENLQQIGMLEIGRVLYWLGNYLDVLLTALVITSVGAIVLSLIGGYFYSRFLFRPIHQLFSTMEAIHANGAMKRLDQRYVNKNDELGRLGRTFNEMIERLEDSFIKQRQFIEDASHELKTPLTIIESYANLLQRWASKDPELRKEAIEAIQSEAARLKSMVQTLLDLAETDQLEKAWDAINIMPLLQTTVNSLVNTFDRPIQLQSEAKEVWIYGDEQKIKQLLIILLDNALKYSDKKIRVVVREQIYSVTLEIIDQGRGIEETDIPHIFDRFYRVDKARNRKTGGTGLGLSIAKNIVSAHHGTIEIASSPQKGTTVTVTLPKTQPDRHRLT